MAWAVSPLGMALGQLAVASVLLLFLAQVAVASVLLLVLAQVAVVSVSVLALAQVAVVSVLVLVLAQLSESEVAWVLVLVLVPDVALLLESDVAPDPLHFRSSRLTCRKLFSPAKKRRLHRSCVHGISSSGRTRGSGW